MGERLIIKERITIKEMPDRKTLEEFLEGSHGTPTVIFNKDEGRFEKVKREVLFTSSLTVKKPWI